MTPVSHLPAAPVSQAPRWAGPWLRFRDRHLFDYPRAAIAAWLAITLAGGLAGGWALWHVAAMPETAMPAVLLAVGLAALASMSATKLPRSTYTFSVSEVFVLASLATLGPAVAVLASKLPVGATTWGWGRLGSPGSLEPGSEPNWPPVRRGRRS